MKDKKCYHCKQPIKWVISDEGNNYLACKCAGHKGIYILDKPFQWRNKDYKNILRDRGEQIPARVI